MAKKAAIYIRVSTERQAEKVSPETQEAECRAYCDSGGYEVVAVFRDIRKYRSGARLVEPSATRADRPGLQNALAEARAGKFNVLVAWREDRLYRSYRPMLDVLDCINETGIDIELVKEHFDKNIAPVKAWAARMELDAKHDRYIMGVAGRLAEGKAWNHPAPYGYQKDEEGYYEINPSEAKWVVKIFTWYTSGTSVHDIRRRLVTQGAPQRKANCKHAWHLNIIRRILRAEHYWTGATKMRWGGEVYDIPLPPLVSEELGDQARAIRSRYKHYPAGNARHKALAAGLVYCAACGVRANVCTISNGRRKDGTRKKWTIYQCNNLANAPGVQGCFRRTGVKKIDKQIWNKLWALIENQEDFERALEERIEALKAEESDAEVDCERLRARLDTFAIERQKVITWARIGKITEDDLEVQLGELAFQENAIRAELREKHVLVGNRSERLMEAAKLFRQQVHAGIEAINEKPQTPEQAKEQLRFRRRIVQAVVKRVDVFHDKTVEVHVELEFPSDAVNITKQASRHC